MSCKTIVLTEEIFDKVKEALESEKEIAEFEMTDEGLSQEDRDGFKEWAEAMTEALECLDEAETTE